MTAPTDHERAFDIVANVECSIHSLAEEQVQPLRDAISAALVAVRDQERERCARIVFELGRAQHEAFAHQPYPSDGVCREVFCQPYDEIAAAIRKASS